MAKLGKGGAPADNFTKVPNRLLDQVLPHIKSLATLKVVLAVVRKTYGWQRHERTMTVDQLRKLTGLSRQAVIDGIEDAMGRDLIRRRPSRKHNGRETFAYHYVNQEVAGEGEDGPESSP